MSDILLPFFPFFKCLFHTYARTKKDRHSKYSFISDIILHIFIATHIGSGWDRLFFHFPAHAVLCFAFLAPGVLVTHWCFGYCWAELAQHQGCLSNPPLRRPTGCRQARGLEGDSWGTWSELTQKIFHTVCLTPSHKREGGKEKGGIFWVMVFAFWRNCHVYQHPTSQKFTWHLSAGMKWWINFFFFFFPSTCGFCFFLLNCHYLNPWSCPFYFLSVLAASQNQPSTIYSVHTDFLLMKGVHNW